MRRTGLLLVLGLAVQGCSVLQEPPTSAGPMIAPERGAIIAQMNCASCHAIGRAGASRNAAAPAFRDLRRRLNPLQWERTMAEIARGGHGDMPRLDLPPSDARDVRAYIETLR